MHKLTVGAKVLITGNAIFAYTPEKAEYLNTITEIKEFTPLGITVENNDYFWYENELVRV